MVGAATLSLNPGLLQTGESISSAEKIPDVAPAKPDLAELKQPSPGTFRSILDGVGSLALGIGGRIAEGGDTLTNDVPKRLAQGIAGFLPLPQSLRDGIGWAFGTGLSCIASAAVHIPTFGALKWMKYLRRDAVVSGSVENAIDGDKAVGSATVNSFLTTVSDPKLRADLRNYVVLGKAREQLDSDPALDDTARGEKRDLIDQHLMRLEVTLSRRGEFNELKELAGLAEGKTLVSEERLRLRAELMADFMIAQIEGKLGDYSGRSFGEWTEVAADGQNRRADLVTKISERLLAVYRTEQLKASSEKGAEQIRTDLNDAFRTSATFREAALFTAIPVCITGIQFTGQFLPLGEWAHYLGNGAKEFISGIAKDLIPQRLLDTFGWAAGVAEQTWNALVLLGGGWLGLKAAQVVKDLGASAHTRSVDGTHADLTVRVEGGDGRPADAGTRTDGTPHNDSGARATGATHTGEGLLGGIRDQANAAADASAKMVADPAATPARPDAIGGGTTARPHVDPPTVRPDAHTDALTNGLRGLPDPSVNMHTVRPTPR